MNLPAFSILLPMLLFCAGCATPPRVAAPQSGLTLSVLRNSDGVRTAYVDCEPAYPLHVLVKNGGRLAVKLWQEDCSWGYGGMQLHVVDADGKEHAIKKKRTDWFSNFPRFVTLRPGEALVWNIDLSSHVWEDLSWVPEGREINTHLTAVYSVSPDNDSKQCKVWTGRVASDGYDIPFYRVPKHESQ